MNIFNYFLKINYSFIDIPKNTYYGKKVFKDQNKNKKEKKIVFIVIQTI